MCRHCIHLMISQVLNLNCVICRSRVQLIIPNWIVNNINTYSDSENQQTDTQPIDQFNLHSSITFRLLMGRVFDNLMMVCNYVDEIYDLVSNRPILVIILFMVFLIGIKLFLNFCEMFFRFRS